MYSLHISKIFQDPSFIMKYLEMIFLLTQLTILCWGNVVYVNAKSLKHAKATVHLNQLTPIVSGGYVLIISTLITTYFLEDEVNKISELLFVANGTVLNLICGFVGLVFSIKYPNPYTLMYKRGDWDLTARRDSTVFALMCILTGFTMLIDTILIAQRVKK